MRRIIVTGGSGQLATAIRHSANASHNSYQVLNHKELDVCDASSIEQAIEGADVVINCAAYTDVEGAESDMASAMMVNNNGVRNLATACARRGVTLVHISTDYVFGGDSERRTPYREEDTPQPINAYGISKLAGERHVIKLEHGIVIRTSWLYAPWGNNFCLKMLRLMGERDTIRVVNDQHGTPTSALGLADTLVHLVDSNAIANMQGVYHYSDGGSCSWYDFATEIARQSTSVCSVEPCSSADYPTKARRPEYSVLDTQRIYAIEGTIKRAWHDRLTDIIEIIECKL